MSDDISQKLPARMRGAVRKGPVGHPGGRRRGSRNKATLATAALLAGESKALTRKAVAMALAGDRPRCGSAWNACCRRPGNAPSNSVCRRVTSALACGEIRPGEAETIAGVVDTFVQAIETTKKEDSRLNLLQI